MSGKKASVKTCLFVICTALAVLAFAQGCNKEPAAQSSSTSSQAHSHTEGDGHDHAADQMAAQAAETTEAVKAQVATAEQTTCPVMPGNPINKDLFVEYQGKKVYFCCKGCPERFQANPAMYVAKLPQFQE